MRRFIYIEAKRKRKGISPRGKVIIYFVINLSSFVLFFTFIFLEFLIALFVIYV